MLVAVAGTLVAIGVLTAAQVSPGLHVLVLITSAVVFGGTLLLIRDLDQPYSGLTGRAPTETEFVRDLIASEPRGQLPCDAEGLPLDEPGFRAATRPLR
jgi:hypothetical protein